MKSRGFVVLILLVFITGCNARDPNKAVNTPDTLRAITITPADATIAVGASQPFNTAGTFIDGDTRDVTPSVTWRSSEPSIATIDSNGVALGVSFGTTTITAISGLITVTARLTVATIKTITVTPPNTTLSVGASRQFKATGAFSNGTNDITSSAIWHSSDPLIATINRSGLAVGLSTGATTITATSGNATGTTILTVESITFTLAIKKAGSGNGTVTSSPIGIDCGTDCGEEYIADTVVTLTATSLGDSTFGGFGGDIDCMDGKVTITADLSCTPNFFMWIAGTWPDQQEKPAVFDFAPYVTLLSETTAVVHFRTNGNLTGEVLFGANLAALDRVAISAISTQQHFVSLYDLLPATAYYYRVTVLGGASMHGTFTTPGAMPVRFVHFGEYHAPSQARDIRRWKELVRQFRPHLAVESGDMVDYGEIFENWRSWFELGEVWLPNLFVLPAYSNHASFNGGDNYILKLFQLPDNEGDGVRKQNYSTRYGDLQFLSVGYTGNSIDDHVNDAWLREKVSEANDGVDDPLFLICVWHQPGKTLDYTPFIEPYGGADLILVAHDRKTEVSKKTGAGRNGGDSWHVEATMGKLSSRLREETGYTVQYSNATQNTMLFVEVNNRTLYATIKDWDGNPLESFQIAK